MVTYIEARALAQAFIEKDASDDLVLLDRPTEFRFGWVFYYQSRRFTATGDFRDAVAGNAPIFIDKKTGALHVLGTCASVKYFLSGYEKTGKISWPRVRRMTRSVKVL